MSGELADVTIARVEQDGRVLSGGTDSDRLSETMERHAPEPAEKPAGTEAVPAAAEGGGSTAPAPDVKPTRGQARFSELAKARDEATKRADAAEARAKELEAKIGASPAAPPQPPVRPVAADSQPTAPPAAERFQFPAYDDAYTTANPGKSYDDWEIDRLDAYADWRDGRANLDDRIAQTIAAREAQREFTATLQGTWAKGREAYPDFDAVRSSGPGTKVNLHADEAQGRQRVAFIVGHPQSEHLQYAIMKDAGLATKLAAMDDLAFGAEIALLAKPVAAPARPAHTPPPAPYTPVNGSGPTVAPPSAELAKKGNFDAYRNKRAQERGVKPRY